MTKNGNQFRKKPLQWGNSLEMGRWKTHPRCHAYNISYRAAFCRDNYSSEQAARPGQAFYRGFIIQKSSTRRTQPWDDILRGRAVYRRRESHPAARHNSANGQLLTRRSFVCVRHWHSREFLISLAGGAAFFKTKAGSKRKYFSRNIGTGKFRKMGEGIFLNLRLLKIGM